MHITIREFQQNQVVLITVSSTFSSTSISIVWSVLLQNLSLLGKFFKRTQDVTFWIVLRFFLSKSQDRFSKNFSKIFHRICANTGVVWMNECIFVNIEKRCSKVSNFSNILKNFIKFLADELHINLKKLLYFQIFKTTYLFIAYVK